MKVDSDIIARTIKTAVIVIGYELEEVLLEQQVDQPKSSHAQELEEKLKLLRDVSEQIAKAIVWHHPRFDVNRFMILATGKDWWGMVEDDATLDKWLTSGG